MPKRRRSRGAGIPKRTAHSGNLADQGYNNHGNGTDRNTGIQTNWSKQGKIAASRPDREIRIKCQDGILGQCKTGPPRHRIDERGDRHENETPPIATTVAKITLIALRSQPMRTFGSRPSLPGVFHKTGLFPAFAF